MFLQNEIKTIFVVEEFVKNLSWTHFFLIKKGHFNHWTDSHQVKTSLFICPFLNDLVFNYACECVCVSLHSQSSTNFLDHMTDIIIPVNRTVDLKVLIKPYKIELQSYLPIYTIVGLPGKNSEILWYKYVHNLYMPIAIQIWFKMTNNSICFQCNLQNKPKYIDYTKAWLIL